jgi:hypothetical protein
MANFLVLRKHNKPVRREYGHKTFQCTIYMCIQECRCISHNVCLCCRDNSGRHAMHGTIQAEKQLACILTHDNRGHIRQRNKCSTCNPCNIACKFEVDNVTSQLRPSYLFLKLIRQHLPCQDSLCVCERSPETCDCSSQGKCPFPQCIGMVEG